MFWRSKPDTPSPVRPALSHGQVQPSENVTVFERFADVGDFQRLLTHGEDAVYLLPSSIAEHAVALDLGARKARIVAVRASDAGGAELQRHLRVLRAQLRTAGYTVADECVASVAVIREILRHPGQRTHNAGRGGPLELFNRWVELAEADDATDIHVEIRGNVGAVRVRVDGSLEPLRDGGGGLYSRQDAQDAIAAGYNSTRKGNSGSQYEPDEFFDCMIGFNTSRCSGQLRFQNLKGRLGPKAVVRILRSDGVAP
jgi:hypothetical protein